MRLTQPPPMRRGQGKRKKIQPKPNVPTVDQVLFLLMENRYTWFVLADPGPGTWGALATALWRRGCEVEKFLGGVRVRWTHDVPTLFDLAGIVRPAYPALFKPKEGVNK
jgi:hypothetical protein